MTLWIITIYLLILLSIGYYFRKSSKKGLLNYFLSKRNLATPLFVATFTGTAFSTASIIGIPGFIYNQGLSGFIFAVSGMSLLGWIALVYGTKLIKLANKYKTYSPIEIVAKSYDSKLLGTLVAIVTICFVIPHLAVQLVGIGRIVSPFFQGRIHPALASLIILLVAFVYSYFSGAKGIAITDLIQVVLISAGMIGFSIFFLNNLGGINSLFQRTANEIPKHLSPIGSIGFLPLVSMIFILASASISQPRLSMRLMMTTQKHQLKVAAFLQVFLSIVIFSAGLVFALGGRLEFPELRSGDEVLGSVLKSFTINEALVALFVAGIISAAMSTIDSQLLAISGVFTRDILQPITRGLWQEEKELRISKIVVIGIALAAYLISLRPPELILEMALLALGGGLQLVPTYIMQFTKLKDTKAACISILFGLLILIIGRFFLPRNAFWGVDPAIVGFIIGWFSYFLKIWLFHSKR